MENKIIENWVWYRLLYKDEVFWFRLTSKKMHESSNFPNRYLNFEIAIPRKRSLFNWSTKKIVSYIEDVSKNGQKIHYVPPLYFSDFEPILKTHMKGILNKIKPVENSFVIECSPEVTKIYE